MGLVDPNSFREVCCLRGKKGNEKNGYKTSRGPVYHNLFVRGLINFPFLCVDFNIDSTLAQYSWPVLGLRQIRLRSLHAAGFNVNYIILLLSHMTAVVQLM